MWMRRGRSSELEPTVQELLDRIMAEAEETVADRLAGMMGQA